MSVRKSPAPKLKIRLEPKPLAKAKKVIGNLLDAYNRKFEKYDNSEFVISLRDGAGKVRGGFYVVCYYDAAFIKWVAIDEAFRGAGLGRELMAAAEKEARKRGAKMIWLDTFSYQARPFYEKLGFRTFGTLKYPRKGLSRAFMVKKLA
ncbi:MAG TPA: GNAT family N-acetyltransferase [Micropepsaceae bacterium]|nr:GNAT family N-acetyltransferase [Micropepsaceae bacterium]